MELKLAAIKCLEYEDFFALFGEGKHPNFRRLLDSKIAPHLSSCAYQFWRINSESFSSSFYMRGYSGWALRLMRFIFSLAGASKDIKLLCSADTLEQQDEIWRNKLRPVLLNPLVVALLKNPVFCWNALGVPLNQRRMLLDEGAHDCFRFIQFSCNAGGVYAFIRDTLDPLPKSHLFKNDNYFYLLVCRKCFPVYINSTLSRACSAIILWSRVPNT